MFRCIKQPLHLKCCYAAYLCNARIVVFSSFGMFCWFTLLAILSNLFWIFLLLFCYFHRGVSLHNNKSHSDVCICHNHYLYYIWIIATYFLDSCLCFLCCCNSILCWLHLLLFSMWCWWILDENWINCFSYYLL